MEKDSFSKGQVFKPFSFAAISSSRSWIGLFFLALSVLLCWGYLIPQVLPMTDFGSMAVEDISYEDVAVGWAARQPFRGVLESWLRWDTLWYLRIAQSGYQTTGVEVAYPPLYPLLIRVLGKAFGGQYLLASLLISWSAFFGCCYLLSERIEQQYSELDVRRNIRNMIFFPTAVFFFAGYTESLFLLLVLLAWRHADKREWLLVGFIGACAVLTRFVGIFLVLPFGFLWWKHTFRKNHPFSLVALMLIPATYYLWGMFTLTNYQIVPAAALQLGWALRFDWPWVGIIGSFQKLFSSPISCTVYLLYDLAIVFITFVSLAWWLRRKKYAESLFITGILLISLMKIPESGTLGSTCRYLLPLFPIFLAPSPLLERKPFRLIAAMLLMTLWLFCAALFFTCNWIA